MSADTPATDAATARGLLARHEGKLWAAALVAAALVVGVGLVVAPEIFWDKYLWEDIWGPTLADARHVDRLCWQAGEVVPASQCGPQGTLAHSGYTLTAEVTYGLVLAALLYGIYKHLLRRFEVDTGGAFIVGLLPLILLGPFARVMEDARVFDSPEGGAGAFAPFFISPWIYFQIALYAIAFLAVAAALDRARADDRTRRATVAAVLAVETAAYAAVSLVLRDEFLVVAPWWAFAVGALAAFGAYLAFERAGWRFHGAVFALGLPLLAPSVYLLGVWIAGPQWAPHDRGLQPLVAVLSLAFAFGATFLVWWAARLAAVAKPAAMKFAAPVSLALVLGHMIDGFATWIALKDPFGLGLGGYVEKHPVSDMLLRAFAGTPLEGLLFPVAKLAMVLLVVHLLAREFSREGTTESDRALGGLIAMAVFVLGFAPGTRNLLLVTMGF